MSLIAVALCILAIANVAHLVLGVLTLARWDRTYRLQERSLLLAEENTALTRQFDERARRREEAERAQGRDREARLKAEILRLQREADDAGKDQ